MVRCIVLFHIRMHVHVHERKLSSHLTNIYNLLEEKFSLFFGYVEYWISKTKQNGFTFHFKFYLDSFFLSA